MTTYFSPSELGYYLSSIHGERSILVLDLDADPVTVQVPDPDNEIELIEVLAPEDQQPHKWVPNPACKIPADAVEISAERHAELLAGASQRMQLRADAQGFPILLDTLAADPAALLQALLGSIDSAADEARRAVAGDALRAVEYDRAPAEAQAFKDAGYPADAVPRTVAAWAIGGRTAQQAADNILLESAAYTEALYQIREARLGAKELVRQAMAAGNVDQAQDIAAETIAAIESAIAGIGNNA